MRKGRAAVAVAVAATGALVLVLVLANWIQVVPSTRELAVSAAGDTLPKAESALVNALTDYPDMTTLLAAMRGGETRLEPTLIGATTRDDVVDARFNRQGVALYDVRIADGQLRADVLVSARGSTSDWTGQRDETAYLCVRLLGTPTQPDTATIDQITCPVNLITIAFVGSPATAVSLVDVRQAARN